MLPRIITRGDHEAARLLAREGIRQLNILKNLMSFGNLKQDVRRVRFTNGSEIICRSIFGIDDVQIYVPEVAEKKKEVTWGRFFVAVRKGDISGCTSPEYYCDINKDVQYYWIKFVKVQGVTKILKRRVKKSNYGMCYMMTSYIPLHQRHLATKTFMLDYKGISTRWISALHLLAIDKGGGKRDLVFIPLLWPFPFGEPVYPTPRYCGCTSRSDCTGFHHKCPPDRFYVNIKEKMLVWYSSAEMEGICGIFVDFNELPHALVYTFDHPSTLGDGKGFQSLFIMSGKYPDMLPGWSEIPEWSIIDILSLTRNEIRTVIPWQRRPIEITQRLRDASIEVREIDECTHCFWDEKGFNFKKAAVLAQDIKSGEKYNEETMEADSFDCFPYPSYSSCIEATNRAKEVKAWSNQHIYRTLDDWHSKYEIKIFDETFSSEVFQRQQNISEYRGEHVDYCVWSNAQAECVMQHFIEEPSRYLVDEIWQKEVSNGGNAIWIGSNVAQLFERRNRKYSNAYADQTGINFGGPTKEDFDDMCHTDGGDLAVVYTVGRCFYGYPMPGDDWITQGDSSVYLSGGQWHWTKKVDEINEFSSEEKNEYIIDGKIHFDGNKVSRTYYLDDRSSDDSEGLIIAGRGANIIGKDMYGFPIYTPTYWKIYHDNEDVTNALLDVLDCKIEELIEIGLI